MRFLKTYKQFLCCFALVCLARDSVSKKNESCYAQNNNPYKYYGTKTAYPVSSNATERITLPNCKPVYIWMYCRHGTRYPDSDTMQNMINLTHVRDVIVNNHENHEGHLCDQDLQNLKNWNPDDGLKAENHKYLTIQGKRELFMLGERLKNKFPELFNANKSENYEFKSTNTNRTILSMTSFISGAFGDDFHANVQINELITSGFRYQILSQCQPRLEEMNSTGSNEIIQNFINGPKITKVVSDVSSRLGFANDMKREDVFLLYDMCRFEAAWYPDKLSPWCAAFNEDDMRIFDEEEDLFSYYYAGPGLETNKQFGCRYVKDMIDRFAKLEHGKDTDEPQGVFTFTHWIVMAQLFTSMGIGKDTMSRANYKDTTLSNWRVSLLAPFATNLEAVFYRCDSEESPFKVTFHLSENPVTLEGCNAGVCDWAMLKRTLSSLVDNCDTKFCGEF